MEISNILLDIDEELFFPIDKYVPTEELKNICEAIVINSGYKIVRDRIFYLCNYNMDELPKEGWKIHISACYWNCELILKIVAGYCKKRKLNFKFYVDKKIVFRMNEKGTDRGVSGKFITIYLNDTDELKYHLEELASILNGFKGPYILTDRRYRGIVFYRYGLFKIVNGINIINPDNGDIFIDNHQPIFQLPYWIDDPIASEVSEENNNLLNERYEVLEVLRYTNAGGTYIADDKLLNKKVIIKEARPYTCQFGNEKDSITLKGNESKILNKLQSVTGVPKLIEYFFEWEHFFVVESMMKGETLRDFAAQNNPMIVPNSTLTDYIKYYNFITKIMEKCIEKIHELHTYNVSIVDISNTNILFDGMEISFVDFDGAIDLDNPAFFEEFTTKSFSKKLGLNINTKKKDYVSLGFMLYSLLISGSGLVELDEDSYCRMLQQLVDKYYLPIELKENIETLIENRYESNISIQTPKISLNCKDDILNNQSIFEYSKVRDRLVKSTLSLLKNNIDTIVSPIHFGDKYSFKYGVSGVIYSLLNSKKLSREDERWMFEYLKDHINNIQGISFNFGLSGVLATILEFSDTTKIKIFLNKLKDTYINCIEDLMKNITDYSLGEGLSGIGMVLIKIYKMTKETIYLNYIHKILNLIIDKSIDLMCSEKIGLESGNTGVALFILEASKVINRDDAINIGQNLLISDIETGYINDKDAYMYPLYRDEQDILFPYFAYGTAGIAYVALEYVKYTKNDKIEQYLKQLVKGMKVHFTVHLGFEKGLSGILFVMCQFAKYGYIDKSYVEQIMHNLCLQLYKTKNDELLCPGYGMLRCSIDLGTGSGGVILAISEYLDNLE